MADIKDRANWKFETLQVHAGQEQPDPATDARAVPIYQTTAYVFHDAAHAAARFGLADPGNIYSRLTNSTQDVLEQRIAALEGGVAALALSSGAAALTYTFQALATQGEHSVSEKTIYGGTFNLLQNTLPLYGIDTTFVEPDVESFRAAIRPNTKALFVETLGNPNSNVVDLKALADLAHEHNIPLVVDATFTPPNVIRTIEHGADIVVHSLTKFIGGHGTGLGGV
ncbi:MAG: aminotransferase class I/II-fold pyridoxal phosphate-dependent enzyme, partial [Clostridiales Family XIII bacterium]|nr:aminotransferase class I/II-fold pyridoxal phosphate-dependent enzyme [Clostridiales Family XIII bacterium]